MNKVLLPRTEKTFVAFADLFLMEKLDELEKINLSSIMLEHMPKVMTLWLFATLCVQTFRITSWKRSTRYRQANVYNCYSFWECESVEGKVKGSSHVEDILDHETSLK